MEESKERLRHEGNHRTITGFVDDLIQLWRKAGRPGEIVRDMPLNEEIKLPRITYRILRRLRNSDFKDIKPRFRQMVPHPYEPGNFMELWGQVFDVYIEFAFFAATQTEADELMEEFEDFIQLYKGTLKDRGVQEIMFYAQDEDEVIQVGRLEMAVRRLQYTVRLEKLTPRVLNDIQQVGIAASVRNI